MAGNFYPHAYRGSASEINRVALIQACEIDVTQDVTHPPSLLTLVKRKVHEYDLLEVSDNAQWVLNVSYLEDAKHRALFTTGVFDRIRLRYQAYGMERTRLQELHDALGIFAPSSIDVVGAWYQNTTTGAISSVTDQLNVNPATQVTAARQPTGAADGSMTFLDDCLLIPPIAGNNALITWGMGTWIELDNLTVQHYLLRMGNGTVNDPAATESLKIAIGATELVDVTIFNNALGTSARRAITAASQISGSPKFLTIEIDLGATELNKVVVTLDEVVIAVTHSDLIGTPGAFPAAMQGAPSAIMLGNRRSNLSTLPFIGRLGKNFYFFDGKMAGATQGLLTATARARLRAYQPMV